MNAIELLKQQHKKTKEALEKLSEGKQMSPAESKKAADELVAHMVIEEHIFYPRVRQLMKDMIEEGYEEHAVARFELARLLQAGGGDDKKTRATVLKELIEHHVEEEEKELFPKVKKGVPEEELESLGAKMETVFDRAVQLGLERLVSGQGLRKGAPTARTGASRSRGGKTAARKRGGRARASAR